MKPSPYTTVGAGGIIERDNEILLVQPAYGPAKGSWILPGGYVEKEEHPFEACQREVQEETGCIVQVRSQLLVRHRTAEDVSDIYFVFICQLEKEAQPLVWPSNELQSARFWKSSEALSAEEVRPNTRNFLKVYFERNRIGHPAISASSDYRDSAF